MAAYVPSRGLHKGLEFLHWIFSLVGKYETKSRSLPHNVICGSVLLRIRHRSTSL